MSESFNVIGVGEILWDLLPEGKSLGGAPANFAFVSNALGDHGFVLSRVGADDSGREMLNELKARNLSPDFIQVDAKNPTGSALVELENGQPNYEITEPVAWDYLELTDDWREIARKADAVCFGS